MQKAEGLFAEDHRGAGQPAGRAADHSQTAGIGFSGHCSSEVSLSRAEALPGPVPGLSCVLLHRSLQQRLDRLDAGKVVLDQTKELHAAVTKLGKVAACCTDVRVCAADYEC